MNKPILTCWGGVGAVTGANFHLKTESLNVLIDCGFLQGVPGADAVNAEKFDYDVSTIDFLFVTHSHIDHVGRIPKLVKDGFKGVIYSTPETKVIAELMLMDTARITENNAKEGGYLPLYTLADVNKSLSAWQTIEYHREKEFADYKVELFDAGHILGSSMFKLTFPSGKSLVFTGDLGNSPSPLLRDTEVIEGADYMLMESVYGDRNHEKKNIRDEKFREIVKETIAKKGTLLIPVFSLERTQVMLYELNEMFNSGAIPKVQVFLDSPLGIHVTEVYERISKHYNPAVKAEIASGDNVFDFPSLKSVTQSRESHELVHIPGPKIILAGSGMSTAGRIVNHEQTFLPDPNTTLLLVGYQAPGTLGRQFQSGAKEVMIKDMKVKINAKIEMIDGFSAHKGSDDLVEFVSHSAHTLKQVFVAMGEPKSSMFLAQRIHDELNVKAVVPERGKPYELDL